MRRALPVLLLIAAVTVAGCRDAGGGGKPAVVATTTQVADMTRAIAGDRVKIDQILKPGSDPHEYEPRPSDAQAVATAKVVIRSGGDVDDWLNGVIGQAGGGAEVVTLIDHVARHGDDPHWWQDPRNAETAVETIRQALAKADPKGAAGYTSRARAYEARLRTLDANIANCVARLPKTDRKLVTSHDALGYYARRYGFTVVGAAIPSLSTQAQPSAAATQRLVAQIKREHVAAIFPESALSPKLEQAIARDAGAKVGGALWADALGPPGSSGATYLSALAANTRTIVSALSRGRETCAQLQP
jgi:zinc/manganese transport system substrate-binding protein/manganese/iron transport system substrate-binding protein